MKAHSSMNLPPRTWDRVHFSCNGPIELIACIPGPWLRLGDTATGSRPGAETPNLWRCDGISMKEGGAHWKDEGPWTADSARKCIEAAGQLVVINTPEPIHPPPQGLPN